VAVSMLPASILLLYGRKRRAMHDWRLGLMLVFYVLLTRTRDTADEVLTGHAYPKWFKCT
jgi:hypothetical protein